MWWMMYERVEWRSIVAWKIRITRIDETESEWSLKNECRFEDHFEDRRSI